MNSDHIFAGDRSHTAEILSAEEIDALANLLTVQHYALRSSAERVLITLGHSRLAEDLDAEDIRTLANLTTMHHYAGDTELDGDVLKDALMILMQGEIEVNATVNNEAVTLHLEHPGDLARIISFVGGKVSIEARLRVKRDSTVLLLRREFLESLLDTHPALAYFVMRNLVRHMHGVARRSNVEKEEMRNYLYCMHGRY